jgi:hypothetical protein
MFYLIMVIGLLLSIATLFVGMNLGSVVLSLFVPYIIMVLLVLLGEHYHGQE